MYFDQTYCILHKNGSAHLYCFYGLLGETLGENKGVDLEVYILEFTVYPTVSCGL